jgi:uncharacterized phage protein (TIGR02218 family)
VITATDAIKTYLATYDQLIMHDLFEISPVGRSTLYYTSGPAAVTVGGHTYAVFDVERGLIKQVRGIEVDNLVVTIHPDDTDLLGSYSWQKSVRMGYLDEAEVKVLKVFFYPTGAVVGAVERFLGSMADKELSMSAVELTVKSKFEIFNRMFPANLYGPSCNYTLYDTNCGKNKVDFVEPGSVLTGSTARVIKCSLDSSVADYYTLGVIEMINGACNGERRTIEDYTAGVVTVSRKFSSTPAIGDDFYIWPGCDRAKSTCETKFSNTNFSGEPFIPVPETVM